MESAIARELSIRKPHAWLRQISVAYAPGPGSEDLEGVVSPLLSTLDALGHTVRHQPGGQIDLLLTSAEFGRPVAWRNALMFSARKRYALERPPTVVTLLRVESTELERSLDRLGDALHTEPVAPASFSAAGLAPGAWRVLLEQGRRGGPILSLLRQVQAQTMCIRNILFVENRGALSAYHFDLVGAHPRIELLDEETFYEDMALRLVTAVSTREITKHRVLEAAIPRETWAALSTPPAMIRAASELDDRRFFTEMIRINDLVHVPALEQVVSSQYSEGCFATWDPRLSVLIATVTGSARPVDKGDIGEDDLAVIAGVREDGRGALVHHVEGKQNDPPSSEAVELMDMDDRLPRTQVELEPGVLTEVPVARSKLHGHRGVQSYDPRVAEFVPLDLPYQDFPVSCSTDAQARAIKQAFSHSETLQNPQDPRSIAFTILPGHGVVLAEKWIPGLAPFEVMWRAFDDGAVGISNHIPQGRHTYLAVSESRMELRED